MGNGKHPAGWLLLHPWIGCSFVFGRLLSVYLGLEDLNSFKTQLWVWKSKDRH